MSDKRAFERAILRHGMSLYQAKSMWSMTHDDERARIVSATTTPEIGTVIRVVIANIDKKPEPQTNDETK